MTPGITVVVTALPTRTPMLADALVSVTSQTRLPDALVVSWATDRTPAPVTRDRGLAGVQTEWVAFLDDDDMLYPRHLAVLESVAYRTGADVVYPWFDVVGGTDPFPQFEGRPWDNAEPHQFPVTFLARTTLVRDVCGGFAYGWDTAQGEDPGTDEYGNRAGEDWRMILRMVAAKAHIHHHPERTWAWRHHAHNTSGLPSRVPEWGPYR